LRRRHGFFLRLFAHLGVTKRRGESMVRYRHLFSVCGSFALAAVALLGGCSGETSGSDVRLGSRTIEGELKIMMSLDSAGAREVTLYEIEVSPGKAIRTFFADRPDARPGDRLRVQGEMRADGFYAASWTVVASALAPVGTTSGALTGQQVRRTQHLAVLLVNFGTPDAMTVDSARDLVFTSPTSAANYFAEVSYNLVHLEGDVFGLFTIADTATCDPSVIGSEARDAATAAGVPLGNYNQILYYHPWRNDCPGGLASIGTPQVPARDTWFNGSLEGGVVVHELLHNFGSPHANSWVCDSGSVPLDTPSACTSVEYGSTLSPMGTSDSTGVLSHFGAVEKGCQGWFGGCNAVTVTSDGVFDIVPLQLASDGIQTIRVPMDQTLCPPGPYPCYYYLEYRQPQGAFEPPSALPAYRGLAINVGGPVDFSGGGSALQPFLLDLTPGSNPAFWDAPLPPSQTFKDPNGITITLLTRDSTRAKVKITFPGGGAGGPLCMDGSAPSAPPSPPASCQNGVQDGAETAIDCGGGTCAPCLVGQSCAANADCYSRYCSGGWCTAPTCSDGVQDALETGVDCGGPDCAACNGSSCTSQFECRSGFCLNGACVVTCPNGYVDGSETDVDCGGPGQCARCATGQRCYAGADCTSQVCNGFCQAPTCTDRVKNGAESDVDCGDIALTCARCATGKKCVVGSQCASGVCAAGNSTGVWRKECQAPTCTDGVKNGAESDVDCGDIAHVCPRCAAGKKCVVGSQCVSGVCAAGNSTGIWRKECQ
jgi:hypothetical protein